MYEGYPRSHIYLDHNATTPVASEVVEVMMLYLQERFGNPSSTHDLGKQAKEGLERARSEVASLIGCLPHEVVFTSGGSESNNMVLKGSVDFLHPDRCHIILSAVEHPSILNPALFLSELGVNLSVLPVDRFGRVDPEKVQEAISPQTCLITVMLANNETGTLQPIKEISTIARARGVPFHTDAAQAAGKIELDVDSLGVDYLTLAGHKLYGPKGVGALYIREGRSLVPLVHGAPQEGGRRAGTESVPLALGLGAACRIAAETLKEEISRMTHLRDLLEKRLFENLQDLVLNGHAEKRLPNTLNVSVPGLQGNQILEGIPELFASTGAACHDRNVKISHVLAAMGISPEVGMGALRLTVGRCNNVDQIEEAARLIVGQVRRLSPG